MQDKSFSKIKKQNPVSVIVHGTNVVGFQLAKILLEQGSKVILIDRFDTKSKKLITELKAFGEADFVDLDGLEDLMKNIGKVDYMFYLQSEFLLENSTFTSKDFLEESNNLNLCLKVTQKFNAKFSLISSISLNENLTHTKNPNSSEPVTYSPEELQRYSETLTAEYHDKSKMNARILRIGAILGKATNIDKFPVLNNLFDDSVKNNAIQITGEGLNVHYMINISDLIFGILKLTFSSLTNGEVISLCNENDYTTLSVAYKLLELNPNASEIKFVPNTENKPVLHSQYIPAPNAKGYGWDQKKNIAKSISETLELKYAEVGKEWKQEETGKSMYEQKLDEIRRKKTKKEKVKTKKGHTSIVATPTGEALYKLLSPTKKINIKKAFSPKNIFLKLIPFLILLIAFYFFFYPIISISAGTFSIYKSSNNLSENLSSFDNPVIDKELKKITRNFRNINKNFEKLSWLFLLTRQTVIYDETSNLLHGLHTGSEGALNLLEGAEPLIIYLNEFEPALSFEDDKTITTREYTKTLRDLERNSDQITESAYKLSQALNIIKNINIDVYPNFVKNNLGETQKLALAVTEQIEPLSNIITFLPDTLGVEGRKRYLILLQNPGELRSTGGWISSYAILGIEGGQIRELVVDDVYNLDGELKNARKFFPAPEDMAKVLNIEESGFSLSNWDPNFPDTAKSAEFFVKEAGKVPKIDGVISIDVFLLQDLLDQWEGIYISGEPDLITSENIHEKVFSMHKQFTPGQSQKATFLTKLADEIIKKIFSSKFDENKNILAVLLKSLEKKNMLIYFSNNKAQQYFSQKGWAGEINPERYNFAPFSVEWNWGANKVNLYIEREQRIKAEILNKNEINYEYSLILKNNSVSKTYPQGEYENFLRVYLPKDAEIGSVRGFQEGKYDTTSSNDFKILSGWFNIPTSSTKELTIEYSLGNADFFETERDEIWLSSTIFKQPGTSKDDLLRMEIIYPYNWTFIKGENFDQVRMQLIKQIRLERDESFNLEWTL